MNKTLNTLLLILLLAYMLTSNASCNSSEKSTPPTAPSPWSQTIGGPGLDRAYAVQQTTDGGFIIAGFTESFGTGKRDVYLVKTDTKGNKQWSQTFGGSGTDWAYSVQQSADGGFIIVGFTESFGAREWDVYLVKTDTKGNKQWSRTFGGPGLDCANSVCQTADGGYIIAGWTQSYGVGSDDVYLIKTDARGNEQWTKTFGGSGFPWTDPAKQSTEGNPGHDRAYSVQQTNDGGYIIAGSTDSYGAGWEDIYLIKTSAKGNEQWSKVFGGWSRDWAYSVRQANDGGYIIAGFTDSYSTSGWDIYLIKTDTKGNKQWSQTFGGPGLDCAYSVQQTADGGYIIAGWTQSDESGIWDAYLVKTDTKGNEQWSRTFGGPGLDWAYSVQQTTDGTYLLAGFTDSYGAGDGDIYLIKTDAQGNCPPTPNP